MQVQLQMRLCEVNYCDFVIWSPCQLVVLRIDYDSNFTDTAITKASECCILPELICKWHSKSVSVVPASRCDKWCYCGGCEEGDDCL